MVIIDPRLDLYRRERASQPLEDIIERMRTQDIKIQIMPPGKDSLHFQIRFSYSDPVKAQQTVQALVTRFLDANQQQAADAQRASTQAGEYLDVSDPPSLPTQPTKPRRAIFAALGFGAGFLSAVVLAVFRRRPPAIALPAQMA